MSDSTKPPVAAQLSPVIMAILALGLGLFTGCGAAVFRWLIGFVHNLAFSGRWSFHYNASVFTDPSPWGAGVILVPMIGGLIVTFLIVNFAPEARGHGVPEVMDAIFYKNGVIRPVVAAVKSVASAIAIGTGAAVGREGPIIQIGSAFGSTLGQTLRMAPNQRIVLVAAGAGGGIAATFNTPIGGVMFALELMMPEISLNTFLPVAIATEAATYVGRALLGNGPAFSMPAMPPLATNLPMFGTLFLFVLLGVVIGLASGIFVRGLYGFGKFFERVKNSYVRHMIGMLAMGLLIYGFFVFAGHYYIEGVGYAMIQALLTGQLAPHLGVWSFMGLLVLFFLAKLFATCICLGSGSSGGIFSPSLFMGASLGALLAIILHLLHIIPGSEIISFAVVGMAAMVAGGTGAAMTGVTMIFEMTRDYSIVIPMIITVAVTLGIRRLVTTETLYTIKLVNRGDFIPNALHANLFLVRHANSIMNPNFKILPDTTDVAAAVGTGPVLLSKDGVIHAVLAFIPQSKAQSLAEMASRNFIMVQPKTSSREVIQAMWQAGAVMAIVSTSPRCEDVQGVITKEQLADSVANSIMGFRTA